MPTIVGRSINISALAILPSNNGIEVSIKNTNVETNDSFGERSFLDRR